MKRISERLADLLSAALHTDHLVDAADLWQQKGEYRKNILDLARWGATVRIGGKDRTVCSWSTMSDCVRWGISVTTEAEAGSVAYADYEIHSADHGARAVQMKSDARVVAS